MTAPAWRLHKRIGSELPLHTELHIDAVQAWDLLSHQARHAVPHGAPAPTHWPVLLEFASTPAAQALEAWCALPVVGDRVGLELRSALVPSLLRAPRSAVHTGQLRPAQVALLSAALHAGVLRRYELGDPCTLGPVDPVLNAWSPPPTGPALGTLGVIDRGFNPAHTLWRLSGGGSRMASLWDQHPSPPDSPLWERLQSNGHPPPYAYGAELSGPALSRALLLYPGLGPGDEAALYAQLGRPDWGRAEPAPAAAMMELLAADRGWSPAERDTTRMPLFGVQLPPAAGGRGIDPLGLHALDAARHIVERTAASALDDNWTSTLVIGPGRAAGPHDGSAMASIALGQLAADLRVTVVAAGGDAGQSRSHLCRVVHQDAPGRWLLRLPPGRTEDTFVQLWLPGGDLVDRFQLCARGPDGSTSPLLRRGHALTLERAPGEPTAAAIWPHRVSQGLHGSLILLALAPTTGRPHHPSRPLAQAGLWQFEITAAGDMPGVVHAWIDGEASPQPCPTSDAGRDPDALGQQPMARFEPLDMADLASEADPWHGPPAGAARGHGQRGAPAPVAPHHDPIAALRPQGGTTRNHVMWDQRAHDAAVLATTHWLPGEGLSPVCTLSQLAHAPGVITAVPYLPANRQVAPGASLGPPRDNRTPTGARWIAPGGLDAHQGLPVAGRFSGQTTELSGSRAAAALVARWLCEGRVGSDVRQCLRVTPPDPHAGTAAEIHGIAGLPDVQAWLDLARAVPGWAAGRGGPR